MLATIFSDGFEGAFPGSWFVGNNNSNTVAQWGDNSYRAATGSWSAFCADNGSNTRNTYDNNLNTYMQRRNINLSGYTSATLTFKYWLKTEASFDRFEVNVRSQSGVWSNVLTDSGDDSALGWQTRTINLNSYAGQSNIYISFDFISDGSVVPAAPAGVWVDDVVLDATTVTTGSLTATVRNQNNTAVAGARVVRYASNWTQLDTKTTNSSGQASWTGIPADAYNLEAYYTGTYWGEEYWASGSATVTGGQTSNVALTRTYPHATQVRFFNNATNAEIVAGQLIPSGTTVRAEVTVRNSVSGTTLSSSVQMRLDRDRASGFDFDQTSSSQSITSGNTRVFTFTWTPSATGQFYYSLQVSTTLANGSVCRTDSWDWAQTFNQQGVTTGSLTATVRNQNNTAVAGARVVRYASNWTQLDTKTTNSSGQASWTGIPADAYNLEAYYTGTYWGEEYWASGSATVTGGQTSNVALTRTYPHATQVRFFNNATNAEIVAGQLIPSGTTVRAEVTVRNSVSGTTLSSSVQMRLDRDRASGFDFDQTSSSQSITSGNTRVFTFTWTPSATGQFYYSLQVSTTLANGSVCRTDSWDWAQTFNQQGVTTGSLTATVRNQNNTAVAGARVVRYASNWTQLDTKTTNSSGQASWTGMPADAYNLEAYYTGTYWGEEYWASGSATVTGGQTSNVALTRTYPHATQVRFFNNATNAEIVAGQLIPSGTTVRAEVTVRNSVSGTTLSSSVQMRLDRDRASGFDFDQTSSSQSITSGNTRVFTFTWTPSATGQFYYSLQVSTTLANGSVCRTDSWDWAQTFNQQGVTTGSLTATVRNQNNTAVAGARVVRYDSNWVQLDTKTTNSSGQASWAGIPAGIYNLETYYTGTYWGEEFWASGSGTVPAGGTLNADLTRTYPHATLVKFYNNATNAEMTAGQVIPSGTQIRAEVTVRNSVPGTTLSSRVQLRLDRDRASSFDFEQTSALQSISSGSTRVFSFTWTPSTTGQYYCSLQVTTTLASGSTARTDSWDWAVAVGVLAQEAQITAFNVPAGSLQRGHTARMTAEVRNTSTIARHLWVGLSVAHQEQFDLASWPAGWFDVLPQRTRLLSPGESEVVNFDVVIPDWFKPGQYRARTAVWNDYDRETHRMLPLGAPFAAQDKDTFTVPQYGVAGDSLMSQLLAQTQRFVGWNGLQTDLWNRYSDGEKLLWYVSGDLSGSLYTGKILGVDAGVRATVLIDLADYFGVTPEGRDGWVTAWVDGGAYVDLGVWGLPIGFGLATHEFTSVLTADVRNELVAEVTGLGLKLLGLNASVLQWSSQNGADWFDLSWSWDFGVALSVASVSATRQGLVRVEVPKGVLDAAISAAILATPVGASLLGMTRNLFGQLGAITSAAVRVGSATTDHDGLAAVTVSVSPASVLEDGSTNLVYTFTRSAPSSSPMTVNFTVGGTATYGSDYTVSGAGSFTASSGTVTIPANQTSAQLVIDPTADTAVEPNETVILTVTSGTGYTPGNPATATGTITNDDSIAVTVTVSPASVLEDGSTNLVYTFTRSAPSSSPMTVNFTVGGTATYGSDYTVSGAGSFTATSGTVTIPANQTSAQLVIDPTADTAVEPNETVILTVTSGTGYTPGNPATATGTITNDDSIAVTVTVSPASVLEDGSTNLVYTFTRSAPSSSPMTVNFTVGGTATYGSDYTVSGAGSFTASSGTVTIPANQTSAQLVIDPTADTAVEPNETVILTVTSGTGYAPGNPATATGTITNDDSIAVTVTVSPASVLEDGSTNLVYTFTRSAPSSSPMTVNFTVGGTATYGSDYTVSGAGSFTASSGTVTIPANQTSAQLVIDPTADTAVEPNETVILTVTSGTGYAPGNPATATGTITNDDSIAVTVTVSPASVLEDGSTNLVYTFTRSAPSSSPMTVNFTVGGTATYGSDYTVSGAGSFTASSGTVTIPANQTSAQLVIDPTADTTVEPNETVILTLAGGTGYMIGTPSSATVTIADGVSLPRQIVNATSGMIIERAAGSSVSIPVTYTTSDNDNTLTGLGLRMHFNSSMLTFTGLSGILQTGLIAQQPPVPDTPDYDNDPATTHYVLVSWADLQGNWPNTTLPAPLYSAGFTLAPGLANGTTANIKFSAVSTATGYGFTSNPIAVRWGVSLNYDIDGNRAYDALTDGLLIMRYLFGFTNGPLIANAIGSGATRTTANEITAYLDQLRSACALDVDGNGLKDALTDGLLIMRYMFGFTNGPLIANAIGAGATRTTADQVIAYMQQYMPSAQAMSLEIPLMASMPLHEVDSASPVLSAGGQLAAAAMGAPASQSILFSTDPIPPLWGEDESILN